MKVYTFKTLGMLGQMYDEAGEEVNFRGDTQWVCYKDMQRLRMLLRAACEDAYGLWQGTNQNQAEIEAELRDGPPA